MKLKITTTLALLEKQSLLNEDQLKVLAKALKAGKFSPGYPRKDKKLPGKISSDQDEFNVRLILTVLGPMHFDSASATQDDHDLSFLGGEPSRISSCLWMCIMSVAQLLRPWLVDPGVTQGFEITTAYANSLITFEDYQETRSDPEMKSKREYAWHFAWATSSDEERNQIQVMRSVQGLDMGWSPMFKTTDCMENLNAAIARLNQHRDDYPVISRQSQVACYRKYLE